MPSPKFLPDPLSSEYIKDFHVQFFNFKIDIKANLARNPLNKMSFIRALRHDRQFIA